MGQQLFIWGAAPYPWRLFLERLYRGEPDAYLVLLVTALGCAVAIWAGANTLKKETRR